MKHDRSFSNSRFLAIACIICIAGSLVVYRQLADQYHKSNLVTHSYITKVTLNQFLLNLTEAETEQRSYLITREQEFLTNYQIAVQKARYLLIILDSLTFNNPIQQERLAKLMSELNNSRLALQASVMVPETGREPEPPADILHSTRELLNNLRVVAYSMLQEEDAQLQRRVSDRNGIMRMNPYIIFLIFLLVLALSLVVYRKLRRETILRIDSETNSAELEEKDRQRAMELAQLNELLTTQNSIFLHAERIAMIGSYTWNLSTGEMQFSDNLCHLLGYSSQEFKPTSEALLRLIHPAERIEMASGNLAILETLFQSEKSCRFITKDGIIRHFRVTGNRKYKPDTEIMVGTFQDITRDIELQNEIKSKTEALLQARYESQAAERFRMLADSMPQIVWTARPDGEIDYFNKRWYNYIGQDAESHDPQACGPLSTYMHSDDLPVYLKDWEHSLSTGQPFQVEFRFRDPKHTGEYCWYLAKALPIFDQDRKIIKWHGTFTDIHDLKVAELSIQKLVKQKEDFISIASHELKTPVTSLKGSIQLLDRLAAEDKLPEEMPALIEMAGRQVNKLSRMVGDLLDVSKLDSNKIELVKNDFPIREAIEDCLEQTRLLSRRHRIRVEGQIDSFIHANKERIEQVITNFLSNAVKYSPPDSEIVINCKREDTCIRISVTDSGIGIPAEKIPFVFDRFFRVEGASDKFSGLGLGLYISSEIISHHQGQIGVISEMGNGSTFWFILPLNT